MEPEQERRLGNCPKPDSEHDHNDSTTHPAGLRTVADPLLQSKSTLPKFATISHCLTNRRIREPYVRWCERLSLRCLHLGAVYSIMPSVPCHFNSFSQINVAIVEPIMPKIIANKDEIIIAQIGLLLAKSES